jgi:hypothetical protein
MEAWLIRYLVVTGIGAAIVMAAPGLVTLGFFLLILPGLILSLLPTAFLWGAVFALFWWPLKRLIGDWPAVPLALAAAFAVLWFIPTATNAIIDRAVAADREGEVERSEPIALSGLVRVETNKWSAVPADSAEGKAWNEAIRSAQLAGRPIDWGARLLACDSLCAATLFAPGVDAVILAPMEYGRETGMIPHPKHQPVLFRIDRSGQCRSPVDVTNSAGGLDEWHEGDALRAEWRARISAGECIVREAPAGDPDFTLTLIKGYHAAETKKPDWAFADRPRWITRLAVADRNSTLLQKTMVETTRFSRPLTIGFGGAIESARFSWATHRLGDGRQVGFFKPADLLKRLTPLNLTPRPGAAASGAREQLAALLDDPARPATDPGFQLPEALFRDIHNNGFAAGDLELVARIIADPRMRKFLWIGDVIRKAGPDSVVLREPIVSRLLRAEMLDREAHVYLGRALEFFPPGLFAEPTADELALLAHPERSQYAPGLIRRQADRGAEAVPLLLDMLEAIIARRNAVGKWSGPAPEDEAYGAIRHALAELGPAAAPHRARLEAALDSQQYRKGRVKTWSWEVALVRMGRAPESFEKPSSRGGSEADWHRSLRFEVESFERDLERKRQQDGAA